MSHHQHDYGLIEAHDLGLHHDLQIISERMIERRRFLGLFAMSGAAVALVGCGTDGSGTSEASSLVTVSPTPTPTPTPTPSPTPTPTPSSSCTVYAGETAGPYPADGTNSSRGSTSNVLTSSGIVRSDITASFLGSATVAGGVPVKITLTLVDANSACAPLVGYAVYLWHCNREGQYSLYDVPAESYLRGVQVTDANGQVTFTTIFPGCYAGRYPHMHMEVFSTLNNAIGGRYAVLTSQLAMPAAASATIYAQATGYSASQSNFARVSLASDNVFGDNTSAQITAMTPTVSGSVIDGYTATALVGIAT